MSPKFFFRADASREAGLGHVRRCAVLAQACRALGAEVHLLARWREVSRESAGDWEGALVHELDWEATPTEDAEWVIEVCGREGIRCGVVDHYRQDESYQCRLRSASLRWLQFGNRAQRHVLLGDLLHDATPGASRGQYAARLRGREPGLMLGPTYALLRRGFAGQRREIRGGEVKGVALTFGGGDDRGATARALEWLEAAGYRGRVEVLTTRMNSGLEEIMKRAKGAGCRVRVHVDNWRPEGVMAECQLAITGGGTTLHELAYLGIPALVASLAENQRSPGRAWEEAGLGTYLGDLDSLEEGATAARVANWLADSSKREEASRQCLRIQDGKGVERVVSALIQMAEGGRVE